MTTDIILPNRITADDVAVLANKFIDINKRPKDEIINIDINYIYFTEPAGVVLLFNLFKLLDDQIEIVIFDNGSNNLGKRYLYDSGIFDEFLSEVPRKNRRGTILTLKDIGTEEYYQWHNSTLLHWLRSCTNRYKNDFTAIKTTIEEIFNNIKDHSKVNSGSVYGQYYPKNDELVIVLADFGIGIPTALRNSEKFDSDLSDSALILKAFEEGVSTESTPGNRGAGLPNIKRLTNNRVSTIQVISNCGRLRLANGKIDRFGDSIYNYSGTFFEIRIDISNSSLYDDEVEEEFEW